MLSISLKWNTKIRIFHLLFWKITSICRSASSFLLHFFSFFLQNTSTLLYLHIDHYYNVKNLKKNSEPIEFLMLQSLFHVLQLQFYIFMFKKRVNIIQFSYLLNFLEKDKGRTTPSLWNVSLSIYIYEWKKIIFKLLQVSDVLCTVVVIIIEKSNKNDILWKCQILTYFSIKIIALLLKV